jgi:tetratricopeptide (TPR) repeat protein
VRNSLAIFALFLGFGILLAHRAQSESAPDAANYFKVGQGEMSRGRFPEAIENFNRALRIEPAYQDALFLLGICYRETGKDEEALRAFRKILEINRKFEPAYLYMASIYTDRGQLRQAEEAIGQAMAVNARSAQATYALGVLAYRRGRLEESIKYWEKAADMDKTLAAAFGNMAVARYNLGNFREALSLIQTAVRLKPMKYEYSFNLGWILRRLGDVKGAERAFSEVLKLGKDSPEALMVEALQAMDENDLKTAALKAREAGQKDPASQRADWIQGLCFEREGKWDEALMFYKAAFNKDNCDIDVQEAFQRAMLKVQNNSGSPLPVEPGNPPPEGKSGNMKTGEDKAR